MQNLIVFNHISLDGYFTDKNGDMSWAHHGAQDPEWDAFVTDNAKGGGTLVFGRITYDLMASFWPTPAAVQTMPAVAERMNNLPKVVFSRTLDRAAWQNTALVGGDIAAAVRKMKSEPGRGMAIFGSGTIVSQLAQEGLIDEYQVVVNPLVLGGGRTMFEGVGKPLSLRLASSRAFTNGKIFLRYQPIV